MEKSTRAIVRVIQQSMFPNEYTYLLRKKNHQPSLDSFPSKSSVIQLTPYLDDDNIMRVGGRLQASKHLTDQQKHPMILPKCFFSKLILRHLHKTLLHPGNSAMLSHSREEYWILGAKAMIRQVKHECLVCFPIKTKFPMQLMSDLPPARVNIDHPFTSTAVDYAGPLELRTSLTRKFSTVKAYIAVFKCMSTGAIHLEAVTSLSSAAFIATFERFISRRGLPSDIFSDNGTTFVGANSEFRRILQENEQSIGEFLKEKKLNGILPLHWLLMLVESTKALLNR